MTVSQTEDTQCDVFISHSVRDQKYASFVSACLLLDDPGLKIVDKLKLRGPDEGELINKARCIVVLLSESYIRSNKEAEEFNVILSRERTVKGARRLYVIRLETLPPHPRYFHLVPCDTCLADDFWEKHRRTLRDELNLDYGQSLFDGKVQDCLVKVSLKHGKLEEREALTLQKATCDIRNILQYGW